MAVVDVGDMMAHVVGVIPVIFSGPVCCPCCYCYCCISLCHHWWVSVMMYLHPVFLWLVNMGYGGGGVLTLGPHDVASGREGTNNREQVGGGGVGRKQATWQQFMQFPDLGGCRLLD